MVLGIQWLAELGPILWDFKRLCMEFKINRKRNVLRGATTGPIKLVSPDHMDKALKQTTPTTVAKLFSIHVDDSLIEKKKKRWENEPSELQELLQQYENIFF